MKFVFAEEWNMTMSIYAILYCIKRAESLTSEGCSVSFCFKYPICQSSWEIKDLLKCLVILNKSFQYFTFRVMYGQWFNCADKHIWSFEGILLKNGYNRGDTTTENWLSVWLWLFTYTCLPGGKIIHYILTPLGYFLSPQHTCTFLWADSQTSKSSTWP